MATWTYEATWGESMNRGIPKERSSVSFTIKRTSPASVDASLYKLASTTGTFSSDSTVKTYTSFTLNFGGYGTSASIASNSSQHAISGAMTGISESLLSVGTSGTSMQVSVTGKSSDSYNYIFFYGTTFTFTVEVADKYAKSSIGASSVNFGENSTVSISNPNLADLNHSVTWSMTGQSHTENVAAGVSSATYQIPASWMDSIPNNTSATCTISVVTKKSNTSIGTTTTTITLNVPASIKPSITSVTAAVTSAVSGFSGQYIQNKTGVELTVNGAQAQGGASITSLTLTMSVAETYSYNASAQKFNISTLKNSGSNTFYVVATDSRGRKSDAKSVTISVVAYNPPSVTAASAFRCNSSGVADENGQYARIRVVAEYTSMTGNSLTINSKYYNASTPGTKTTAKNNMTSGTSYTVGGGNLDPSNTYYIQVTLTDNINGSSTYDMIVQTAAYSIHVKNGGMGVAFGKTSEHENSVEINQGWNLYYKGRIVLPVVYSESTAPSNPVTGLVRLKKKT